MWQNQTTNNIPESELVLLAEKELSAVMCCDIFINIYAASCGSHVEFGAALSSKTINNKKKIFLWSENSDNYLSNPSAFCFHPYVERCSDSLEELADLIKSLCKK